MSPAGAAGVGDAIDGAVVVMPEEKSFRRLPNDDFRMMKLLMNFDILRFNIRQSAVQLSR
jgi:hypothetical protein